MKFINGNIENVQSAGDVIFYTDMVNQYDYFVNQTEQATPQEVKEIYGASKLFLNCTRDEAIEQYGLVGTDAEGVPKTAPLIGVTSGSYKPKQLANYDLEGNLIDLIVEGWNIKCPDNIEDYDLSGIDYEIIEV